MVDIISNFVNLFEVEEDVWESETQKAFFLNQQSWFYLNHTFATINLRIYRIRLVHCPHKAHFAKRLHRASILTENFLSPCPLCNISKHWLPSGYGARHTSIWNATRYSDQLWKSTDNCNDTQYQIRKYVHLSYSYMDSNFFKAYI